MPCLIPVLQVTPIVRRSISFSAAMVASWSIVAYIFLTPLGEAAACGLRLCPAGEARDGEGEAKSMGVVRAARLGRPRRARARRNWPNLSSNPVLSIMLPERKGGCPWCSPRLQLPPLTGPGPGPPDPLWQLARTSDVDGTGWSVRLIHGGPRII